jgi:predicted lipoprotein with Yx(FWY)xxD motif
MPHSLQPAATPRRWRRSATLLLAAVAGIAVAAVAGIAIAKSFNLGVGKNVKVGSKHETIVVNSHGVSVYELIPESKKNPLCKASNQCLHFWPPVTVGKHAKLSKAPGVKGKLGTWKRLGFTQLTLDGHPLYTFSFDHNTQGIATGDKIHSFNGIWHVIKATAPAGTKTTTTTTSTTSTSTSCAPYCYPMPY